MVYQVLMSVMGRAVLPPVCVLCGGAGQAAGFDLCAGCLADLPVNSPACLRCGEHLIGLDIAAQVCGACLHKAPRFHSTHCAYRYAYPVDHLVRALKYHDRLAYGRVLGELLVRSLQGNRRNNGVDAWPQCLIPVPLATQRYRERGFNQSTELARHVAPRLGIALRTDVLERTRRTHEQAGLDRPARRRNVRGAFALTTTLDAEHVAIVDDVVTTGSTANEIARVLKRGGVKRIDVWAVARASR